MKRTFTIAWLSCMLVASVVQAQPVRNGMDVIWAKDVAGATMTLDGVLDEAVWQQAETIDLVWNGTHQPPGSGQKIEGTPNLAEPSDPNDGTIYILRDGNTLWLAAEVNDASVGGSTGLWNMDGLIMNILDRARFIADRPRLASTGDKNFFQGNRTEFFVSWWNSADTTDGGQNYSDGTPIPAGVPLPDIGPRLHGYYGGPSAIQPRPDSLVAVWDVATVVDGTANDDTHGDDNGYVIEMRLDMGHLGYDFDQAGGDKAAWNIALQDYDFGWPANPDINFASRVWWQNQWGNNFNHGAAYIVGAPGVTVDDEAPAYTEPEFTVQSGSEQDAPTIDGTLDEEVWDAVDPQFYVQYQPDQSLIDQNPEIAKYYVFYFRPDINGDGNAAVVVDPSIAEFRMFHRDNTLYVGVDVNDQAISGTGAEGGMDGIYLFVRYADSTAANGTVWTERFDFSVDSTGAVRYGSRALAIQSENPDAVQAAVGLKGASTPADPTDVDEGYQIEIAIDLVEALGYDEVAGGQLWTAMNFLDGDFLESAGDSYATRTWIITERGGGGEGASIYGYLDPNPIGTAAEAPSELPTGIALDGNYPNPFNPSTTLRYALPQSGNVSVQVFDMLGREVAAYAAGFQSAGRNEFRLDAAHLASGMYVYRLQVSDVASGSVRHSAVGQMVLVK